jgi:predicted DNA-binding protein YlxM (UPF0122 family)
MLKDLKFNELYSVYKNLLTEKQQELFYLYYMCDLSLSEISEMKEISRQGVQDTINKACKLLESYESKLAIIKKKSSILEKLNKIQDDKLKEELIKVVTEL